MFSSIVHLLLGHSGPSERLNPEVRAQNDGQALDTIGGRNYVERNVCAHS